jgi:alpha-2-macroglobulin
MKRELLKILILLILVSLSCQTVLPKRPTPTNPQLDEPSSTSTPVSDLQSGEAVKAILEQAYPLDRYPPNAPILVRFNQRMNPDSAHQALLSYPWTEVQESWDDTYTLLTVTPTRGLPAEQSFQLFLNQDLRSASGAALKESPAWKITTPDAPFVTGHLPGNSELKNRRPHLHVSFSRAMDAVQVAAALNVQPQIKYELSWRDDKTLLINPLEALAPGTRYRFTLSEAATDLEGIPLGSAYQWDHWLGGWDVAVSFPFQDKPGEAVHLNFTYPVDRESMESALRLEPQAVGRWFWSKDTDATIFFDEPLPLGKTYTLSLEEDVQDANGDLLPSLEPWQIITPPPILDFGPRDPFLVDGEFEIWIQFDRPMSQLRTEGAFHLMPEFPGKFSWVENTLNFAPSAPLPLYTEYTVTLDISAVDEDGNPILMEPFTWTFYLQPLYYDSTNMASFGEYGPNGQVLDAGGRRSVQFVADPSLGSVTFELYRMTLEQFLDRYSSRFRGVAGTQKLPISTEGTVLETSWVQSLSSNAGGYSGNIFETFIPDEVGSGLYIINLLYDGGQDQLILVHTRNTIVIKQVEGQILAWVSDINGGSLPNLPVSIYARDGVLVVQGETDGNGIFRSEVGRDPQPLIVIAQDGEDITVSGLSNEWTSPSGSWWSWWAAAPKVSSYVAFIYTDRPIYRPGQTVFFKAILRSDEDVAYSTLPEGTPLTVRIRDARDNVVQTYDLAASSFGSVDGDFTIAEGAMLGSYDVEVELDGERQRQEFKVQDYRKPDYQVTVNTDMDKYVSGGTVQVTVQAEYFFGEPVANAPISVQQYNLWEYTDYWAEDGPVTKYVWGDYYGAESIKGVTDRDGVFTFSLPASYQGDSLYYYRDSLRHSTYSVEVTVDDGSHQTVSNYAVYRVYNAAERLTLDTSGYFKLPGEPFTVRSSVSTLDGDPVGDRSLSSELRRWNPSSYDYDIVAQSERLTTERDGIASLSFTIERAGYYQMNVSLTDQYGNPANAVHYVYAFREGSQWFSEFNTSLRISADRESYLPGDTAQLIIESKFSGVALLTFERGKVHREQIIQLEAPLTRVEVPILESDAPNIFVSVNAYQGQENQLSKNTYSSFQDSQLQTAFVNLIVPITGRQLDISIIPDREFYTPRDEVSLAVRVTNEDGQPVLAEVSIGVVDEAIYSLSEELTRPMFDIFYSERDNLVRTYDSMALRRELYIGGRGGGGGDGLGAGPRSQFPDTAAWFPVLFTDSNGEVQVTIPLPDSLTSWRITARAVTVDTYVGEEHINILTQKPIVVRPILPRSLTAGDLVDLTAMVHNYSDKEQELSVSIEDLSGLLEFDEPLVQDITLASREVYAVGWSARALQPGEVHLVVRADPRLGEADGDSVLLTLPIQPLAIPDVTSQSGAFTSELVTALYLPPDALSMSGMRLELSPSIAGSLLYGLEYLTGYPYGCVEQTMSRALPNAVIGRAFNQLGILNPTLEADMPGLIGAGLQKLYGYQHPDGGWGWWFDDSTNDYQTAWVIFGLAVTSEAGNVVDPQVIQRGVEWLQENLEAMDIRTRTFALFSMTLADAADMQAAYDLYLNSLFELDTFSQAALALILEDLGLHAEAADVVSMLAESAVRRETLYFWPQPQEDGHYYDKTMASTTRSTAMALQAFLNINPDHPMILGIVEYLMSQRKLTGWGSTNETAFTILSLTGYLLNTQSEFAGASYGVELNGERLTGGELGGNKLTEVVEIPASQMKQGQNTLRIHQSGSERLYFTLTGRSYMPLQEISSDGNVHIERTYLYPQTDRPLREVVAGQLVRVQLRVKLPKDGFFVILEDRLPGGFEALNESLNTTSHESTALGDEPRFYWQEYGYNNKEVRADRVSFFISELPAGEHTYTYLARATHSGIFVALPAELSAMYDPSLWGRSTSTSVEIAE